ncbi:cytochrome P450 [Archangium sp.]|jgi:cytochrome P450|uniref:cytochrome P450 n=1 Tax=Archangium sp. TaxID=1872627 RepID=UPI002ED80668
MNTRPNLFAPDTRANPYPLYAELRRNAPVFQVDPGGFWAISRYDDVLAVLKNPRLYSSEGFLLFSEKPWLPRNALEDTLLAMDPPRHDQLRSLISRAFGAKALARLEPRIRACAEELASRIPSGRTVDFVEAFSMHLPSFVIGTLLGLPTSTHEHFKRWANDMVNVPGVADDDLVTQARTRQSLEEMDRYLNEAMEERRRHPQDDFVSDLLRVQVDGESLTPSEQMGFLNLLLVAGLETTVHLLNFLVQSLAEHPDVLARVREDRSRVPAFIEEVLRYHAPVQSVLRLTTAEVELHGVRLPPGSPVLALIGSANRDETHFNEPDRFDISRTGTNNMPFGHGAHFCIGAALARMEARIAMETLLDRFQRFEVKTDRFEWNYSLTVRGPWVMPVELHAA